MITIPFLSLQRINASYQPQLSAAMQHVIESGWYLNGAASAAFEAAFARYLQVNHCVGVANGMDALTLALMAMRLQQEWDSATEVIVPNMTFFATAQAVIRAGLTPVLADVDADCLLSVSAVQRVATSRTRCIIPVHLYGHAAPMQPLMEWAEQRGIMVLEDAAQAHGASIADGRRVGGIGHMAAFSFYPGKNLGALGDGGAVTTNDAQLATLVRQLANYGTSQKYHHQYIGLNSRLDEVQAAALHVKLTRLDADNAQRRRIAAAYGQLISNPHIQLPYQGDTPQSVFHIYPIRCKQRGQLQAYLAEQGVETLIHYPVTINRQEAFAPYRKVGDEAFPQANQWADEQLSLPISPLLTSDEVSQVAAAINRFLPS